MRHVLATLLAAVTVACLAAVPSLVLGHVELTSSSPAAGDNLDTAPSEVSITFDDELDPDLSSFTVTDADGNEVGNGEVDLTVADRNVMTGPVDITDPGVYTVSYSVAGVDGHEIEGSFSFGFQADEEVPQPDTAMPEPRSPILPILGVTLLAAAGALAAHRLARLVGLAASVALVAGLMACVPAGGQPANCHDASVSITATLMSDGMEPASFDVCRDQQVTITITPQVSGELHFHGYDAEIEEQPVTAGQTLKVEFKAIHPGQFPIELHPEQGEEVEVAALVVHAR